MHKNRRIFFGLLYFCVDFGKTRKNAKNILLFHTHFVIFILY